MALNISFSHPKLLAQKKRVSSKWRTQEAAAASREKVQSNTKKSLITLQLCVLNAH